MTDNEIHICFIADKTKSAKTKKLCVFCFFYANYVV